MKPLYLDFCGINSFSERAEINFTSLLQFGIFGIFGDTGSGKSTILDCIAFAVYGDVGRARAGSIADIINYKSDKATVNFEFAIVYEGSRRTFRVERELKRKNAVQSARVYERKGESLLALSEGVRDSNALLKQIVGLEQRDFEKCIALPQGEFAQFVKCQRGDRLKLVARLFSLEEYGERLVKKINTRCGQLQSERDVIAARAEPYAEVSEAGNQALLEQLRKTQAEGEAAKAELSRLRAEEKTLASLAEKQKEAEKVAARLAELEKVKGEIAEISADLTRLARAEEYLRAEKEYALAEERFECARKEVAACEEGEAKAIALESQAKQTYEAISWDSEIERLSGLRAKAEQSETLRAKVKRTEEALQTARVSYRVESEKFRNFSYEAEKEVLLKEKAALGEGDFTAFLNECKAGLFGEEYSRFVRELEALRTDYPVAEEGISPLIEKYRLLAGATRVEFSTLTAQFERRESAREQIREKLTQLEQKNGLYRQSCERLQTLQSEGVRLKEELNELTAQLSAVRELDYAAASQALERCKREKQTLFEAQTQRTKERERANERLSTARMAHASANAEAQSKRERRDAVYLAGGFSSNEEAARLVEKYGDAEGAKKRVEAFEREYVAFAQRRAELVAYEVGERASEKLLFLQENIKRTEERERELSKAYAVGKRALEENGEKLVRKKQLEAELARAKKQAELFERLKALVSGNKFIEFVAEEYLQSVAEGASGRLLSLTDGRYFLRYQTGGFFVGDNFNGGNLRGVYTLSGGETFLVSLSLALSLSAEICAKSLRPIEFFFLDEGFGTLDERLVDTVMDSLERLKNEHFSIGIISHVEELKHRIDRKLTVVKASETHGSQILAE